MNNKLQERTSTDVLEQEYRAIVPTAINFSEELSRQISHLLRQEGVSLGFPIQSRIKAWPSIVEKIERLSFSAKKVTDFQDLVGLRIILLFQRDVQKVCNLLSNHFTVLRQYDTQSRLNTDQFGYSSIHFVLQMPEVWTSVPTLAAMRGLKAEVQVRTIAQHTWAEASNILQYKQTESVPAPILRSIYRVSALLETIDLEFERVLDQRDSYRAEILLHEKETPLSNVDLLETVLDALLPVINKSDDEDYAELLADLHHFNIHTQQDLISLTKKHLDNALIQDKSEADYRLRTGYVVDDDELERAKRGIFYNHTGLVRTMLGAQFARDFQEYMREQSLRDMADDLMDEELPF
jgi:ppGpp synthetase/RelA/SpoT-type nucleotidyltranferase